MAIMAGDKMHCQYKRYSEEHATFTITTRMQRSIKQAPVGPEKGYIPCRMAADSTEH